LWCYRLHHRNLPFKICHHKPTDSFLSSADRHKKFFNSLSIQANKNTIKNNKDRINEILRVDKRVKIEEIALPLSATTSGKIEATLKNKRFYNLSSLHQQEKSQFFMVLVACQGDAT